MDIYGETQKSWDKLAKIYNDSFMNIELYNESYDYFCCILKDGKQKILEIGCGPGNITQYIGNKLPNASILATDTSATMLEFAKKNNPNAEYKILDAREIQSLSGFYDGIICGFCIPYLSYQDVEVFLNNSFKLLRENGVLYLSFVEGEYADSSFQVSSNGERIFFHFYKYKELNKVLENIGFQEIKKFDIVFNRTNSQEKHKIIILKK